MLVYLSGERKSLLHPLAMGLSIAFAHSLSLSGIAASVYLTHQLIAGNQGYDNESITLGMQWISAELVIIVDLWMSACFQ